MSPAHAEAGYEAAKYRVMVHNDESEYTPAMLIALLLTGCGDRADTAEDITPWSIPAEGLPGALLSLWRSDDGVLWTVGADPGDGATVLSLDASGWTAHQTPGGGDLWWVLGIGGEVWSVGAGGRVLHHDGAEWTETVLDPLVTLFGIWGSGAADIWAVGGDVSQSADAAGMWHYDGAGWTAVELPADAAAQIAMYKLWGRSASEVYAVGTGGVILAYDGTSWQGLSSPTDRNLFTLSGTDADLFAVGGAFSGTILHSDGGDFTDETPDLAPQLNGVSARSGCDPVAVGTSGSVYHRDGTWTADARDPATLLDLHAVLLDEDCEVWAVGGAISSSPLSDGVLITSRTDVPEAP
jgi:hypothetical protein